MARQPAKNVNPTQAGNRVDALVPTPVQGLKGALSKMVSPGLTMTASPGGSVATSAQDRRGPDRQQISQRAREIWEANGCPTGQDEENWLEAEKQLRRGQAG